jgi:hypothetical protein
VDTNQHLHKDISRTIKQSTQSSHLFASFCVEFDEQVQSILLMKRRELYVEAADKCDLVAMQVALKWFH